jgi:hypothetical protein
MLPDTTPGRGQQPLEQIERLARSFEDEAQRLALDEVRIPVMVTGVSDLS